MTSRLWTHNIYCTRRAGFILFIFFNLTTTTHLRGTVKAKGFISPEYSKLDPLTTLPKWTVNPLCSMMFASRALRNAGTTGNRLMNESRNNKNIVRVLYEACAI